MVRRILKLILKWENFNLFKMSEELVAEESYGEESFRAQYFIHSRSGQLKKLRMYEYNGLASVNKFIKVKFNKFINCLLISTFSCVDLVTCMYLFLSIGCIFAARISK